MSMKRTIKAKGIIKDIRAGMTDPELITKYGLTSRELEGVLAYLIDSGLMTREQLEEGQALSSSQIIRAFVESQEGAMAV